MHAALKDSSRRLLQLTYSEWPWLAVVLAVMALLPAGAASVTLAWNASADPRVSGYELYYGSASQAYTNAVSVGLATTNRVSVLAGQTYYFAATSVTTNGLQSDYSNEVSFQVPPGATNSVVALWVRLKSGTNAIGPWNTFTNLLVLQMTNVVTQPKLFFSGELSVVRTNQ